MPRSGFTFSWIFLPAGLLLRATLSAAEPASAAPSSAISVPPAAAAAPASKPAAAPAAAPKKSGTPSPWMFSLLPKSFQKNPNVEMTVITEMTDDGKKLPESSPQSPAYFVAQSAGFHSLGEPSDAKPPLPAELEDALKKALAANGYLPADPPAHPPSLLVIYSWGAHYALHPEDDPSISQAMVERNILDRAGLVGGTQLADKLKKFFQLKDDVDVTNHFTPSAAGSLDPGPQSILDPDLQEFIDPIEMFARESPKNAFVISQAFDDVFFVVASAYDYAAAGQHERRLLWRTRMTVDAKGIAMNDTLPTLIDTAAPYFGRDMPETETLVKRALKDGRVDVGTPRVVPDNRTH